MSVVERVLFNFKSEPHWVWKPFHRYCLQNHIQVWSADDLHSYIEEMTRTYGSLGDLDFFGLTKDLMDNPNLMGNIILSIKTAGLATQEGRINSQRPKAQGRSICTYNWTPEADREGNQ